MYVMKGKVYQYIGIISYTSMHHVCIAVHSGCHTNDWGRDDVSTFLSLFSCWKSSVDVILLEAVAA